MGGGGLGRGQQISWWIQIIPATLGRVVEHIRVELCHVYHASDRVSIRTTTTATTVI